MTEVCRSGQICLMSYTPAFLIGDDLDLPGLRTHLKTLTASSTFVGFTICCLCENEDLVVKLDLYPHVFRERTFLFKPSSDLVLELCALLSTIENSPRLSIQALLNMLRRARHLTGRSGGSQDARFLLQGIETLVSTTVCYYFPDMNPPQRFQLQPPLLRYKFYKAISNEPESETGGLLQSIFFDSVKMSTDGDDDSVNFNIFYLDSIFTKHLANRDVVKNLKRVCLRTVSRDHIL